MTGILGLPLDDALERLEKMGECGYTVQTITPPRGGRDAGTVRVVAVRKRERVLIVSKFIDMFLRAEIDR